MFDSNADAGGGYLRMEIVMNMRLVEINLGLIRQLGFVRTP
jgi:hypothetical protein